MVAMISRSSIDSIYDQLLIQICGGMNEGLEELSPGVEYLVCTGGSFFTCRELLEQDSGQWTVDCGLWIVDCAEQNRSSYHDSKRRDRLLAGGKTTWTLHESC